jgi:hypothetical protein
MDMPPPNIVHCSKCTAPFALLAGETMPKGWTIVDGEPVCGDCTNVGPSMEAMMRRVIQDSPRAVAIGPAEPSRFRGCRIGHEIALGTAAIEIRAGANPPEGRDERVRFLLHGNELDHLIIELSAIRAELTASPPTDAGEGEATWS